MVQSVNSFGAADGIFWEKKFNIMTVDVLALWVARTSVMVLTMQDKLILVCCLFHLHEKKFKFISIFPELRSARKINSFPPSATHMRQGTGWELVQAMACRLFGAKPLHEPMLAYCLLDSWEQMSAKFESGFYNFHTRKCISNCRLPQ